MRAGCCPQDQPEGHLEKIRLRLGCLATMTRGCVWSQAFKPKNALPIVRHGGGTIMLWASVKDTLYKVDVIMKDLIQMIQLHIKSLARWLKLGHSHTFQQNNDPNTHWNCFWIKCLEWSLQSTNLNNTEHVWTAHENQICTRTPTSFK